MNCFQDNQSEMSSDNAPVTASGSRTNARAASRISNQSSLGRARRASVCSLPASLINLGEVRDVTYWVKFIKGLLKISMCWWYSRVIIILY